MLHIAICDDSEEDLQQVAALTDAYLAEHSITADVRTFSHPDTLLSASEKSPFDLYLLDVVMPMISGIEVGQELRRRQNDAPILYLTTSSEFAVDAFSVHAVHYLIKPVRKADFCAAMARAFDRLASAAPKRFPIRTEGGSLYDLNLEDIFYIESVGHLQRLHCKTGLHTEARRSLALLEEDLQALAPGQFVSPYKGYLVNLRAVRIVNPASLALKNGGTLPLAKRRFRQIREVFFDYNFKNADRLLML